MSYSSLFYILDIHDGTLTESTTQTEILLFGIKDNKRCVVRVTDVPFCLFVQVPDSYEADDVWQLKNTINAQVRINKNFCMRTNCCGNTKQEDKRQKTNDSTHEKIDFLCTSPCAHKIRNDKSLDKVVSNASLMMLRSCVGYYKEKKKFACLTLTRPFVSNQVCKFLYAYMKTQQWNNGEEVCEVFMDATTAFAYSYHFSRPICTGTVLDLTNVTRVNTQKTECEEEYIISYKKMVFSDMKLPPPTCLSVLAFDIETSVRANTSISTPDKDEILLITGAFEDRDYGFTWGNLPTNLPNIVQYRTEKEMLEGFLEFIRKLDPDIITGFRCNAFDWEFIFVRAKMLGVPFMNKLSKVKNFHIIYLNAKRSSGAGGSYTVTYIICPGRLFIDVYPYAKKSLDKQPSYSLDHVSYVVLKERKIEFDVTQNNRIFYGESIEERDKFFMYGLRDSRLALRLFDAMKILNNVLILSNIVGMTVRQYLLIEKQEQLRNLARRFFWPRGFVTPKHENVGGESIIPYYKKLPILAKYEGGTVLKPKPGRYLDPVITLDINSMYPSIMRSANLCISTVCTPDTPGAVKHSTQYCFIPSTMQKGLFPEMLELLIKERNDAKANMAKAEANKDVYMQDIYNIMQKGLKEVANSLYGTTGAPDSIFKCPYAAATTTAIGRECFQKLLDFMLGEKLETIYGDTDSIFAVLRGTSFRDSFTVGKALSAKINSQGVLPPLVKIAFENVKWFFMIFEKKKYVSTNYTDPDGEGKLSQKGTVAVMSDNAPIAGVIFTVLTKMMMDKNTTLDELETYVRQQLYRILNYDTALEMKDFIIAQSFRKELKDYANPDNQVHIQALKHWKRWSPSTAPVLGDKIPYLIARMPDEKAKMGECVRPPFMLKNIREVDVNRFVNNKLVEPISKFLRVAGFEQERVKSVFDFRKHSVFDPKKKEQHIPKHHLRPSYLNLYKKEKSTQPKITDMFKPRNI